MARMMEGKETWYRLSEWDRGQAPAERLAAVILHNDGFQGIDPSHPLGGRDGKKDIIFTDNGNTWIAGVYFPRGQQKFSEIKKKFVHDLKGVETNNAYGFAFITNQELRLAERQELCDIDINITVQIYHLERILTMLNIPVNYGVRLEFLDIEMTKEEQLAFFANISSSSVSLEKPSLTLKGILDDKPSADLHIFSRHWLDSEFMKNRELKIGELHKQIVEIIIPEKAIQTAEISESQEHHNEDEKVISMLSNGQLYELKKQTDLFELFKTVDAEINENMQNKIIKYYNRKNLSVPNDFFLLGNLKKQISTIKLPFDNSKLSLLGTEEEQRKYSTLMNLYREIDGYTEYFEYFSMLEEKYFVKCIACNIGTSYDEDVDIKLLIPQGYICDPKNLPLPGYSFIEWYNENSVEEKLFKLQSLVDVDDFSNYPPMPSYPMANLPMGLLLQGKSAAEQYGECKETYTDSIKQIFCYKFHKTSQYDIWSFNVPYIKQNTNMSFPSLLIFDKLPDYLEFEIRSKHFPDIVAGKIPIITKHNK